MKLSFVFRLLPFALCLSCSLLSEKKIYVSTSGNDLNPGTKSQPLSSLEAAQKVVREYRVEKPQKDIKVIIGEGTWYLDRPLTFTAEDGGSDKSSVVWEGQGEGKTTLSGGKVLTGCRDAGYDIWWAQVDTSLYFEQLYVNGQRATRARIPDATDSIPRIYLDKSTWVYHPDSTVKNISVAVRDRGLFESLMPSGDFEMVVFKDWTISRFRASSLNDIPAEIYLKPPFALFDGSYNSIFAVNANRYSCYLEGDPVFISQPGEWALERSASRLYYKPLPGQTPSETLVVAAVTEQLIILEGTKDNMVKNLKFIGIQFQDAAYRLPVFSHDGMQAAFYYGSKSGAAEGPGLVPPAIEMKWAANCTLTRCRISNIGGNGIYLREGCRDNRIGQTSIEDIGGNGVMIGMTNDPGEDSLSLPVNNTVAGCDLSKAGIAFQGAVGIWLGFGAGNEISDCDVYDLPYTGISVGWQWNPLPTSSKNNRILNNRIHNAMQVLGDGGGIYTLGYQPGSVISGNDIYDILRSELNHASDNNGMFIDEGSKGYRIENNTIRNTAHTSIRGHRTAGVELIGNTFYPGKTSAVSHTPPYDAMIFVNSDTTITWKNPGWPKEWGYPDTVTAFTMRGNRFIK
ncbi:MAG: right-handed parallel beta-helix repeat-containing protein [Bacteroidota bacterium]